MLSNKRVLGLNVGERSIGLSWHGPVHLDLLSTLELLVLFPEFVDTINHLLDKLNLRVSQPVLVGDVIGMSSLATTLSPCSTGLQVKLFTSLLQLLNTVLGPSRQVNMDRGSHTSSKIGGAGMNISILGIKAEVLSRLLLHTVSNSFDTSGKPLKDSLDISSLLHRDDSELILLIDPDKEGLGIIVEDTSALWPVTLHTSNSQISVTRDKEEVVINKLLSDLLIHASKGVVLSSEVTRECRSSILHEVLNSNTLLLGDSRAETKSINGSSNPDSGRVNRNITVDISIDFSSIHIRSML